MTFHGKMVSNQGLQSDNKISIQTISNSRIVTFNKFKQTFRVARLKLDFDLEKNPMLLHS